MRESVGQVSCMYDMCACDDVDVVLVAAGVGVLQWRQQSKAKCAKGWEAAESRNGRRDQEGEGSAPRWCGSRWQAKLPR